MKTAKSTKKSPPRRSRLTVSATGDALPERRAESPKGRQRARLNDLIAPFAREVQHPLAALIASSQILAEELGPHHPCVGFARVIHESSERINSALSDLLALMLPMEIHPRRVDLMALLNEQIQRLNSEAEKNGVRISTEFRTGALHVRTDPDALRLAIGKLFRFSLDAMPFGGVLRVVLDPPDGGRPDASARISISDTGPRISDGLLLKLFEPFSAMERGRPGIALALCRKIVESLGGTVVARNNPDVGLTIQICLPPSR